jgi:hypothetical protein
VAEWLQLFESAAPSVSADGDGAAPKPRKKRKPSQSSQSTDNGAKQSSDRPAEEPGMIKSGSRKLDADEVSEWLEIFGQGDD